MDRKNNVHYLIKWRELAYDQATWEGEDMDVPEFDVYKAQYWNHRWVSPSAGPYTHTLGYTRLFCFFKLIFMNCLCFFSESL